MPRTQSFTSLLAVLALTGGCMQQGASTADIQHALPSADAVRINLPASAARSLSPHAVGDTAQYYVFTRDVTMTFNAGAAWVLIVVNTIVHTPPTSVKGNVYTWGPGSKPLDPADWKLIVTAKADGSYDWELDGRNKMTPGAGFTTVISGNALPGASPHRGSGSFMVDFNAAEKVDPVDNHARGTVAVTYDLDNSDGTPATLDMQINGLQNDAMGNMFPVKADYHYAENADQSGDFQFSIHADIDGNSSGVEDAAVRSRWLVTGAGRADGKVQGGDLPGPVTVSQCWDSTFAEVYYTDSANIKPTEGDESACAFASADYPNP